MHQSRFGLQAALVVFMVLGISCTCGKPPLSKTDACLGVENAQPDQPDSCGDTSQCGDHYSCRSPDKARTDLKCCMFAERTCNTESDCCPGQICPANLKSCRDKYTPCKNDLDCGSLGDRFCEAYTDNYGTSSRCRFKACGAGGTCQDGTSCFQGECVAALPCSGFCEAGKGCVASADQCQDYSAPSGRGEAACPMTCTTGFIATFKDGRNIWDTCTLSKVGCVCAELPSIHSNDLGRFSAVDVDPGRTVFASSYDGQYGDLVVTRFNPEGVKLGIDYIDGVPAGAIKYGPSGARGGIVEPGPDVGRYTDIAVNNGQAYVSYYDVTNGDLKVAVRTSDGTWSSHKVDGIGDTGLYSSIGVDSDGLPGISYFMRAADENFNVLECPGGPPAGERRYLTALKFARAVTQTPKSPSDWSYRTIACLSRPPPPCDSCGAGGVCGDIGAGVGATCYAAATGCTAACDSMSEACVSTGTGSVCAKKVNPTTLTDIPLGVGMFSSIAFNGKEAVIAYMRRTIPTGAKVADGDLYAVRISAFNVPAAAPVVIEANGDTGYFPSVKYERVSKSVAISFHNFTSKTLKFYYSGQLQTGVPLETIDTGIDTARPGEQSIVGTDSALIFGPSVGQLYVVYQDSTRGDLKVAKRGQSGWSVPQTVTSDGAVGFFADGTFMNGKLFVTHARLHSRYVSTQVQVDNSLKLEQLPAN